MKHTPDLWLDDSKWSHMPGSNGVMHFFWSGLLKELDKASANARDYDRISAAIQYSKYPTLQSLEDVVSAVSKSDDFPNIVTRLFEGVNYYVFQSHVFKGTFVTAYHNIQIPTPIMVGEDIVKFANAPYELRKEATKNALRVLLEGEDNQTAIMILHCLGGEAVLAFAKNGGGEEKKRGGVKLLSKLAYTGRNPDHVSQTANALRQLSGQALEAVHNTTSTAIESYANDYTRIHPLFETLLSDGAISAIRPHKGKLAGLVAETLGMLAAKHMRNGKAVKLGTFNDVVQYVQSSSARLEEAMHDIQKATDYADRTNSTKPIDDVLKTYSTEETKTPIKI